jgi:hypothetical protein
MKTKPLCNNCLKEVEKSSPGKGHMIRLCEACSIVSGTEYLESLISPQEEPQYSLEIYENHAIIRGTLNVEIYVKILEFCSQMGFRRVRKTDDGSEGIKLVRK